MSAKEELGLYPITEVIDKLFLELSQWTSAKTARELKLESRIAELEARLERVRNISRKSHSDWEDSYEEGCIDGWNDLHEDIQAILEVTK